MCGGGAIHSICVALCVQRTARAACPASGRMFSRRPVHSTSGKTVPVGPSVSSLVLNVVAWPVRRHVPPSIFDGGSRCARPQRLCIPGAKLFREGPIALLTHRPPNTKGDDATDRKIQILRVGRAVLRISDVDLPRGENPCWWGHPLTKGQYDLGVIEWGQRVGRRWQHRVQMS